MLRKLLLVFTGLALAFIAGLAGFYLSKSSGTAPPVAASPPPPPVGELIGSSRPAFRLTDVAGRERSISEWDGKVLAINFWATWCPPCIKEIPEFVELQQRYGDEGLQFIGIALQRPEEVTDFMREKAMNYPVLAGEMDVIRIAEAYGNDIGALPYTVIIDRRGRVHFTRKGPLPGKDAEAIILELL